MEIDLLLPLILVLLSAAVILWIAIGNMQQRLKRVKDSEAELTKDLDLTLEAWAKVLEYRDKEAQGHSQRLVEFSTKLALALGLSPAEIGHLRRGALLHDVGKLAIPDAE
jgi:HD-GYP domain-containing protein (c-di-GMP phosphodiesterase class II)